MRRSRAIDLDPAAEMMHLATEVADGMAATAAFAALRLSDRAARLGDSAAELASNVGTFLRARPLVLAAAAATLIAFLAWRWSR